MKSDPAVKVVSAVRFPSRATEAERLAVEEPLEIRVNGQPLAVTMRTPGHDAELAAGFCFTEGVVDDPDEIERVQPCHLAEYGNVVDVLLADSSKQFDSARRELYLSSSCGLCGTRTLDKIERRIGPLPTGFAIPSEVLTQLPRLMLQAQDAFTQTGGLHAAALFTIAGDLRFLREDVGRHNAVDKVIGGLLLAGQLPAGPAVLVVSGRASFELVQKAARAGLAVLAAVGAPSSLAVEAAERFGMTLVGFLKEERFNVYAGAERVM